MGQHFDMNGKIIKRIISKDINDPIDVSDLPAGNYLVKMGQGSYSNTLRIIKQ